MKPSVNMPNLNEESASPSADIDVTDESIDRVFNEEKDNTCPLYTSSQNINELNLADELLTFFIFFNLTRDCMQHLLSMLNRHGVRVPETIYLLKKRTLNLKSVQTCTTLPEGNFSYIGIFDNLKFCITNRLLEFSKPDKNNIISLNASINIDGLPLYKSSNVSAWPILLRIEGIFNPFPVAVFCGIRKPALFDYLSELCNELLVLLDTGMSFSNCVIKFSRVLFICDSPARAYIFNVMGHNSKVGCHYCRGVCSYKHRRVVYPTVISESRTDEMYRLTLESNQKGPSPLSELPKVGFYSCCPPDYQHAICLSVTRKLFLLYFTNDFSRPLLSRTQQTELSRMISTYSKFTPHEFQRRPRSIERELKNFKATEFRIFLLYFGPFFFKKFLSSVHYNHFLLLHFAIYVFSSEFHYHLLPAAHRCIEMFVYDMKELFGDSCMSYNVHILLHFYEFVQIYGNLSNFSTFPFENYLSHVKKRVRPTRYIFEHIIKQVLELRPLLCNTQIPPLKFSNTSPNNCAIVESVVVYIEQISDNNVSGRALTFSRPLYDYPYSSECLGIGFYSLTRRRVEGKPQNKCILIPIENEFLVIPYCCK